MKIIQSGLNKQNGTDKNIIIELSSIYRQGKSCKLWIPHDVAKDFLLDYRYSKLLLVTDTYGGALVLFKLNGEFELKKLTEYSLDLRRKAEEKIANLTVGAEKEV
jgi:hypothetical protein